MDLQAVPNWETIPRMLRDRATNHGDIEVVVTDTARLTLADLATRAGRVARALMALGVRPGDRVAVWAPNAARWVVAAYGIWDAGAVLTPVSTRAKGIEAVELLRGTGASVLLVDEGFMGVSRIGLLADACGGHVDDVSTGLPELRHVVTLAEEPLDVEGAVSYRDFLAGGSTVTAEHAERRALAVRADDLAEVLATSGTTGTPKGVMLEHAQLLRAYWDWSEVVTLRAGDRYPIIAPFSHGFGVNAGLLACVLRAATMMPVAVFSPDALMAMIERDRVGVLAGPPTLFYRILDEMDSGRHDVSSLRAAICGAAAVPPELIRRLIDTVGLERMVNAYGLIEGTVVSMTRSEDPVEVIATSTGRAVPGVSVRVVDDDGAELPPGERGEILVGGYGVMRGYWNDPERTAEALDADGRLRTGDIGVLDERGNLAIVDRKKEMFIVGGFNAYPAEIEALLLHHPDLSQAAVIGVPDTTKGEVGQAYVVPRPGASVEADDVVAWARENMSNYKAPRRVVVVDELPANVNGKVDKQALRARAAAGTRR